MKPESSESSDNNNSQTRNQNLVSPTNRSTLNGSSIFTANARKAPLKIKVNPALLNKINSSKKFGGSASLAATLAASRTVSRVASGI